jgi:hypothetical protein
MLRKKKHIIIFLVSILVFLGGLSHWQLTFGSTSVTDPLPSWNNGAAKQAIIEFVETTTGKSSTNFVPLTERIATFDQDGTLWVEHPMYTQVIYLTFHGIF